jgi:rhamnulokinase
MIVLCSAKDYLCYDWRWSKAVDNMRIAGGGISFTKFNRQPASTGLDTWGVDFALLDSRRVLLSKPFYYRDEYTDDMLQEAFRRMPPADMFIETSIQFMQINTLYPLLPMSLQGSPLFDVAKSYHS